jgi:hypothetical protein
MRRYASLKKKKKRKKRRKKRRKQRQNEQNKLGVHVNELTRFMKLWKSFPFGHWISELAGGAAKRAFFFPLSFYLFRLSHLDDAE